MSFDFGHDEPTSIHLAQVTPKQIQVYFEHYLDGQVEAVHKARMLAKLRQWAWFEKFEEGMGERVFSFWTAVGDPSGLNYKANYATKPFPIYIDSPSDAPNYRDKEGGESLLDGYLQVAKRCCWQKWPAATDKCRNVRRDARISARDRHRSVVRKRSPRDTGAGGTLDNGRRARVPDHAVDDLRYLCLRAKTIHKKTGCQEGADPVVDATTQASGAQTS